MPNTVIALKKSATPSATPSDLANGELAINYSDGKLYYKHSNGTIVQFSAGGAGSDSFGTVNANGTLIVADTAGDILTLEAGDNITITADAINDKITISATGGSSDISPALIQANTARDHANAAFNQSNTAFEKANSALANTSDISFNGNLNFPTGNISANSYIIGPSQDSITYTDSVDGWYFDRSFSVSAQETEPRDVSFSSDGTKMFILGNTGNDITVYNLSSAWNVETATVSTTFSVATQEATPTGLYFKPDGTKFYVVGQTNDVVYQYTLSNAWNVSTASYESKSFSVNTQENAPNGIYFSSDGTAMFIVGQTNDTVYQYTLGTAWDVSTASYASKSLSVAAYDTIPEGISFNSAGTKLWVLGATFSRLIEYNLSVAWDISTATFSNFVTLSNLGTFDVTGTSGIYVNESQGFAYVTDYGNDRVFQLITNNPSTKLVGTKWVVEPDLFLKNDLIVDKNSRFNGNMRVVGSLTGTGTTTFSGAVTLSSAVTLSATISALGIGTSQTTGTTTIGGTTQTGIIQVGRSTVAQAVAIANGATTSGNTKTVEIGTRGLAGSITNITVGSDLGTSNVIINGLTNVSSVLFVNDMNVKPTIESSFDQANTGRDHANSAFAGSNAALIQANAARDHANSAFAKANTSGGAAYFSGNNGDVGSASGLGDIFRVHTNTLTANVTIYSGNNALAAGPISISLGKVLTIQDGARVVIV